MKSVKYINVMFRSLIPKLSGKSKKIAIAAIVGMDKPILASAEPKARFKLLCKRLALAALTAANPSGSITNIAIAIPTIVFGAPTALTPASIAGLKSSARLTTKIKDSIKNTTLTAVLRLLGFGA
jgi:hypothetical protein